MPTTIAQHEVLFCYVPLFVVDEEAIGKRRKNKFANLSPSIEKKITFSLKYISPLYIYT